jgi:LPS-assembly lipoprotein
MTLKFKKILILFVSLIFVACGFQLRGTIDADFKTVSVYGGSNGFQKLLIKRFKQSGIQVVSTNAEKMIEIISDKLDKRILSLSSEGTVKEYELRYEVVYRYKNAHSDWGNSSKIELIREYTYDDSNRVAKELEEKNLVQGMSDQIIRTLVSQISVSQ